MFQRRLPLNIVWSLLFVVTVAALTNTQTAATTGAKIARIKSNLFDPVLSANTYIGRVKENEQIVRLEPALYATDADPSNSNNGKICGYELSWHKHDDLLDEITPNIPFTIELLEGQQQPVVKINSNGDKLDCETKQTYRLFVRAYDCASNTKRRYSERSSLIITVDDVNEFVPVFTHDNYLFKLHQDQTCAPSGPAACRVEATDDDCSNSNNRVCNYEILTPDVPFAIDSNGALSITKSLIDEQYEFDIVAVDCYPTSSTDNTLKKSRPARVTFKVIKSCTPTITDESPSKVVVQSDHLHVFDTVHVDTCDETCTVEDIVGTIELDANGSDSGCDLKQCASIDHEAILIPKDNDYTQPPVGRFMSFDGRAQAWTVDNATFAGDFNADSTIRMWLKHTNDNSGDKEHIFCKSDKKLKNRHHTGLFIQNNHLKFLLRKGPMSPNDNIQYGSEWIWQLTQINDGQWHSYKIVVHYPDRVDLFVDEQLIVPNDDNFQLIKDFPLAVIDGTEGTVVTMGACWHARASRMVQHFHGQISGLTIEQKQEIPRSTGCIQECHQYLDMPDIKSQAGAEFVSNTNRSVWIVRTDSTETFEQLLKHIVYRNTFDPIGPPGQRTISLRTNIKCLGENSPSSLPRWTRQLSIDELTRPTKIELKGDTNFYVPEDVINQGIYLFRNLSIYTDAIKTNQADISDCSLTTTPELSNGEELIIPDGNLETNRPEKVLTRNGAMLSGSASIDMYQFLLQQIAYISKSPVKYIDRTFALICVGAMDQLTTNEIRVRVHIGKEMALPPPGAAILSDKLIVDNEPMHKNTFDVDENQNRNEKNVSSWPIAVVVCVSVGLALVLVLYLVIRIRSNGKQRGPTIGGTGDDMHSQMEWEDDIGLNITVNPLDETRKPVPIVNMHDVEQTLHEYAGSSSDDGGEDSENDLGHNHNDYSSDDDDDEENNHVQPRKPDHQLEWDDAAIEYGPKKV